MLLYICCQTQLKTDLLSLSRSVGFIFRDALLLRTKQEEMVAVLHTNLLGTILTCRAALRSMLHTEGAAIVNIGPDFHDLSLYLISRKAADSQDLRSYCYVSSHTLGGTIVF